jgi:hypothetical protein
MKSCLIACHGFFGDHFFASSIAKHLKEENQFDKVDYVIGWPQVKSFFERNPFIDEVFQSSVIGPNILLPMMLHHPYDKIFHLEPIHRIEAPAIEFQKFCGVQNPSAEFSIYTDPKLDEACTLQMDMVRNSFHKPIIAIMNNWQPKAFLFTKEEYERGIDVPYKGYGGKLRDIPRIVSAIGSIFPTVAVGAPENINQFQVNYPGRSLDQEASIIKACDYFIGAEGGLANIAGGVGTKTILTSDFVHQLYGWNGVLQKLPEPKLGPRYYFPTGHIDLDPYLTDDEVISQITEIVNSTK